MLLINHVPILAQCENSVMGLKEGGSVPNWLAGYWNRSIRIVHRRLVRIYHITMRNQFQLSGCLLQSGCRENGASKINDLLPDLFVGEQRRFAIIIFELGPEPDHPSGTISKIMKFVQCCHELVNKLYMIGVLDFDCQITTAIFHGAPQILESLKGKFTTENRVPFFDYCLDRFIKPAT